jgi:hypothetical protein
MVISGVGCSEITIRSRVDVNTLPGGRRGVQTLRTKLGTLVLHAGAIEGVIGHGSASVEVASGNCWNNKKGSETYGDGFGESHICVLGCDEGVEMRSSEGFLLRRGYRWLVA